MSGSKPRRAEPPKPPLRRQRSLVLVNTGEGKGKSTAAFGVVLRGVARGWRVSVIQFVKSDKWKVGEEDVCRGLGVEWARTGDGFSWLSDDLERSAALAKAAWALAAKTIRAGEHRLVVLDEITYPINWGWISGEEVARVLRERPEQVNVIATGRDAPAELLEVADTVTEMRKVRHAYDQGVRAKRGIDF
ncbi:MAG TPA: cob(I)yrinic acid a,c-diamide adenosyltransferase [Solirubrobacterales bacterium]|nr:cob(I)yrinic acid a,c-diamide adenosyltransferase [Solirubrobacterales bacterium]